MEMVYLQIGEISGLQRHTHKNGAPSSSSKSNIISQKELLTKSTLPQLSEFEEGLTIISRD